jgi:predicted nucleotidyltransferase
MKYGLKDSQIQFLKDVFFHQLLKPYPKTKIWIFGSRARGSHKLISDIDLLIESPAKIPPQKLSLLRAELEESAFPFKIDLVLNEELAESYRDQVEKDKKLFLS